MLEVNKTLYVNNKWYMDIMEINDDIVSVRIKYIENPNNPYRLYKIIKIHKDVFKNCKDGNVIYCDIDEIALKKSIGNLKDRIVKEKDIYKLLENVGTANASTSGMGAVSNPGLSGNPGTPGSSGSGDISVSLAPSSKLMPKNEFGLQIDNAFNKKIRKKLKTKVGKTIVKKPIIDLTKENLEVSESDADYKNKVFQFLDYPTDNAYDVDFIEVINKHRADFIQMSSQRIKKYFKDIFTINKNKINDNCSEWFKNNILILSDETEIK